MICNAKTSSGSGVHSAKILLRYVVGRSIATIYCSYYNTRMDFSRVSGILLHPTSLPGSYGIGTLGKQAFAFIDFLVRAHIRLWQVLPLGPTGYGDSPYQSFSTFALNPLLIDLDDLAERGWAERVLLASADGSVAAGAVDYGAVVHWKLPLLHDCAEQFLAGARADSRRQYATFCEQNAFWLNDFALFMSIKTHYDALASAERQKKRRAVDGSWNRYWAKSLARHDEAALNDWRAAYARDVDCYKVIQFFAFTQWQALKDYANAHGVSIVGDIPIFVAADSADVWANQRLFQLNKRGVPKAVAGVPPDYFSATGQLWGNPLYNWAAMKKEGYAWWISRIRSQVRLTDYVRIDHFRGFEAYWAVPYGSKTAETGAWKRGPGKALFNAIKATLGDLPLIAEDLGVITDGVRALRDGVGLPGMKVLQFAFDVQERRDGALLNAFLPHTYDKRCVVYTGTHDNDTTQGWLTALDDETRALVASYVRGEPVTVDAARALCESGALCRDLVRLAFASVAEVAVIPLQDVYALGSEARMNTPSTSGANWSWRMDATLLAGRAADEAAAWLCELVTLYGRDGKERQR